MLGQTSSLVVVLMICNCLVEHRVDGATNSSTWRIINSNKKITAQDTLVSASSEINCAFQCHKYWNCVTFAFQSSSGRCHLNPTFDENTASDEPTKIYRNQDPICNLNDVPTPKNTVIVPASLKQTLTSYEVNVTCADGFRRVKTDIVTLRCFETGQWESKTTDICKQQIWQNCGGPCGDEYDYEIPGRVDVGWKAYFAGQPTTATYRFSFDLHTDSPRRNIMHFVCLFDCTYFDCVSDCCSPFHSCIANRNIYNEWQEIIPAQPTPFAINQPFVVIFAATDVNEIEIYVDGSLYMTFPTTLPVSDIKRVVFSYDNVASYIDLWYSPV